MAIGMKTIRAERAASIRPAVALLSLFLGMGLGGCPREVDDEPPPRSASSCERDEDCNAAPAGGAPLCGELFACVASYCEETPNLIIPCED